MYEVLLLELTKSVVNKDKEREKKIVKILKDNFNGILKRELDIYKEVYEDTQELSSEEMKDLIREASQMHFKFINKISEEELESKKSALIKEVNYNLGQDIYQTFLPNYKELATIHQIFYNDNAKSKMFLQKQLVESREVAKQGFSDEPMDNVDLLEYKFFSEAFNEEYGEDLLDEQKEILHKYVMSIDNKNVEFKVYLNNVAGNIKNKLQESKETLKDETTKSNLDQVIKMVEDFKVSSDEEAMLEIILKCQSLVHEIENQ